MSLCGNYTVEEAVGSSVSLAVEVYNNIERQHNKQQWGSQSKSESLQR